MANSQKSALPLNQHRRRAFWIGMIILIALLMGSGAGVYYWQTSTATLQDETSVLQTAIVRTGDIKLFASGTGTLIPRAEASFGFRASGQVVDVAVKAGDRVEAGQVLAMLESTAAQLEYLQAKRALDELLSPAAIASAELDVANDKTAVKQAREALAYLISPTVLIWEERVAAAEAEMTDAKADAEASPSSQAEERIAAAETSLKQALAGLSAARAYYNDTYLADTFTVKIREGRNITYTILPPTEAAIAAARATYAKAQLTLTEDEDYLQALCNPGTIPENATGSKITELEKSHQTVAAALDSVDARRLVAPISGTILAMEFGLGDLVGTTAVISIADLNQPYLLDVYLDESDWENIRAGYPVEVLFDILPDRNFEGIVLSVDPNLSSQGQSMYIHAVVELKEILPSSLPTGTGASVDVIGGLAERVLLVPVEALREIDTGEYAVFVMRDGKPRMQRVEVGLQDLTYAEIKSGLSAGDVVTTGIAETN